MLYSSLLKFLWPYYKSKLELKSNSNEILPVNCKFICDSAPTYTDKTKLEVLKFDFQRKKDMNTDKLAINWQNFARVRLQLKFASIIRPLGQLTGKISLELNFSSSEILPVNCKFICNSTPT